MNRYKIAALIVAGGLLVTLTQAAYEKYYRAIYIKGYSESGNMIVNMIELCKIEPERCGYFIARATPPITTKDLIVD